MSKAEDIFRKPRLSPRQLRSVAELRFADAVCLLESGNNARATGAMYVGGLCEEWTVYARYSPKLAKTEQARRFVDTIREVKEWLKEL